MTHEDVVTFSRNNFYLV